MDGDAGCASNDDETPVFVGVGEVSKRSRPLAPQVRLKAFDYFDMSGVYAFENGGLAASVEILFRIHNRKLRAILFEAGIDPSQFVDKIVKGTP